MLELSPHLRQHLPVEDTFDRLLDWPGKVHRQVKHRRTVEFELGGRRYFIKVHRACGWFEVIKDWLQGRPPIVSARSEWEAIERLVAAGVPTPTVSGRGERGRAPARMESFIITDALVSTVPVSDLVTNWGGLTGSARRALKLALIGELAGHARRLHGSGLNHRDFYLCHFLAPDRNWRTWQPGQPVGLHLIDLHRVQIRDHVPHRWLVKDLGGLWFSALDAGFTRRDCLRFIEAYRGRPWREVLATEAALWRDVERNARRLYRRIHQRAGLLFG